MKQPAPEIKKNYLFTITINTNTTSVLNNTSIQGNIYT